MISEELLKDRIDIELCRFFRSKIDLQVAVRCPVGSVLVQHLGGRNSESVDHGGLFGEYVEFLRDHVLELDLLSEIALNMNLRFAIREGGRTVGAGQVTEILD